jgi:L-galactose dehydrogenase
MDMVRLGRTNLMVSVAGLGTGGTSRVGQAQGKSFDHSVRIIHEAIDLGINLIDTSSHYGTEEIVGAALKGRRDKVVISTKNLMVRPGTPLDGDAYLTAAEFKAALEGNLRRLGTDHVEILHVHGVTGPQYAYCRKELLPVLHDLRKEGKIGFAAISERFNIDIQHEMLRMALPDNVWDVVMVGYNFVNHTAKRDLLPVCVTNDVGTLCIYAVRNHLANPDKARKFIQAVIATGEVDAADLDPEDPLGFLLTEGGARSLTDACYRYSRHTPGAHVILTGTGSVEHLRENVASINAPPLPKAVVDKLDRIFARVTRTSGD